MILTSKKAISKSASVAVIAIIIIAAGIGVYYYSTLGTSSSTTTSSSSHTTTSSSHTTTTSSSHTTTTSSQQTTSAAGPTPAFVKSNTFVDESSANYQYLDPNIAYYAYDYGIQNQQYEPLLWWNGTDSTTPIPWLASSYTVSNDGLHYTFNLRQGITFQDGEAFNATAVCFTMNRILMTDGYQPTGLGGPQWIIQQVLNVSLFSELGGDGAAMNHSPTWVNQVLAENFCQILSTYKVELNLQTPSASFPLLISGTWADIVAPGFVVKHDFPAAITSSGVNLTAYYVHTAGNATTYLDNSFQGSQAGTGPYEITSVNPTTYEIKMTANPNYWGGPPGYMFGTIHPTIQNLDFVVVADATTRILDLKGGTAAGVGVPSSNIFALLNQTAYDTSGQYVSDTPNVNFYGPYSYFNQGWFEFNTNVTNTAGQLNTFQPFSDLRFRLAVADAVNVSSVLDSITYGMQSLFNWMEPPGTLPVGSYVANAPTAWSYNLTEAASLLKAACASPIQSFTYFNGSAIPPGTIDNSCNGQTVTLYYQSGATITEKIMATVAANLNAISIQNGLGVTFSTVPVPAGTLYSLAASHLVNGYWAGWLDDYNWAIDWTGPMFLSTQTYPYWSQWNFTSWNNLANQASAADAAGNISGIVAATVALSASNNKNCWYWYQGSSLDYRFYSTWVTGWFWNPNFVADAAPYFAVMSFQAPGSS